jgi:hypothetical protein
MTMRGLRTAISAAAGVLLAAGVSAGVASAAGDHAAAAEACQPGTLISSISRAGDPQTGMNHEGVHLRVENTGKTACIISGYPGLALEGAGHTAIKTTVQHGDTYFEKDAGAHEITIQPGKAAYADMAWTHLGQSTAHVKYVQISPTGGSAHTTVGFVEDIDKGALSVTAWSLTPPSGS